MAKGYKPVYVPTDGQDAWVGGSGTMTIEDVRKYDTNHPGRSIKGMQGLQQYKQSSVLHRLSKKSV